MLFCVLDELFFVNIVRAFAMNYVYILMLLPLFVLPFFFLFFVAASSVLIVVIFIFLCCKCKPFLVGILCALVIM
jgi:hypothetical protein